MNLQLILRNGKIRCILSVLHLHSILSSWFLTFQFESYVWLAYGILTKLWITTSNFVILFFAQILISLYLFEVCCKFNGHLLACNFKMSTLRISCFNSHIIYSKTHPFLTKLSSITHPTGNIYCIPSFHDEHTLHCIHSITITCKVIFLSSHQNTKNRTVSQLPHAAVTGHKRSKSWAII